MLLRYRDPAVWPSIWRPGSVDGDSQKRNVRQTTQRRPIFGPPVCVHIHWISKFSELNKVKRPFLMIRRGTKLFLFNEMESNLRVVQETEARGEQELKRQFARPSSSSSYEKFWREESNSGRFLLAVDLDVWLFRYGSCRSYEQWIANGSAAGESLYFCKTHTDCDTREWARKMPA